MSRIVSVEQMKEMEAAARASGVAESTMMERAGLAVADAIRRRVPIHSGTRVAVLVGPGHNGGDGLIAARALLESGAQIGVYLAGQRPAGDPLVEALQAKGVLVAAAEQDQRSRVLKNLVSSAGVVVDAVLGTGARSPLTGPTREVLETAKQALAEVRRRPVVVAVDCPSGVNCDTGTVAAETLTADLTVTMAAVKKGLLVEPALSQVGEITLADIGIPSGTGSREGDWMEAGTMRDLLPARPRHGHKGTFGRVIVAAGSINYPGAALLAARAAYRAGAGLVTLAVPAPVQLALASSLPEATWLLLPHEMGAIAEGAVDVLGKELAHAQALVLGPGVGQEGVTTAFFQRLFNLSAAPSQGGIGFLHNQGGNDQVLHVLPPCVVDADGLRILAGFPDWPSRLPPACVLTPHPGEMAALTGRSRDEIQTQRVELAARYSREWKCVVVLKGAYTVVASPEDIRIVPWATTALAHAGTGDVLAGAIGGLLAQGLGAFDAASLGAFLHAQAAISAGQEAGSERGILAHEVADGLPRAAAELERSP